MKPLLLIILSLTITTVCFGIELNTLYEWKYVDYVWENPEQQQNARKSNLYNPSSVVLYDTDVARDGRVFVTSVKEEGVPASLMTVTNKDGPGGPLVKPYPNWSWYTKGDCNDIISVYRIWIKCNYLFVLDCGDFNNTKICPAKLLIFDLRNDMLVQRIIIPDNIANNANGTGLLVTPLVYVKDCNRIHDATVFMADILGDAVVIYHDKSFCRIESKFMQPTNPDFTIEGDSFHLEDGPIGLALMHGQLFYSILSGVKMYKIDMRKKGNCSKLKREVDKSTQLAGTLSGQTGPIASKRCAIFFSNIPETSILCQDATKEFNSTNTELIVQDHVKLQFPSGLKVKGERLLIVTNRYQRVMNDILNTNETNFRILSMDIKQISYETNCFASCSKDHNRHQHHRQWHNRYMHRDHHDKPDSDSSEEISSEEKV